MSTAENKKLMQDIYAELAKGNPGPFYASLAEEVRWTITGSTAWSKTYQGKRAVEEELLRPLRAKFAGQYRARAQRVIAEDDLVVVEARGEVLARSGAQYDNAYCYVFRLSGGRVVEITEYMDTALLVRALGSPVSGPVG